MIEKIALEAGFHKDKYGLYWDQDANSEGVDLEKFAELIVKECAKIADSADESACEWIGGNILTHFGVKQ